MQLDAYTVRKAVPRILLAVIGINLSIYLCLAMVDITEVVAKGIGSLLTAPFVANGYNTFDPNAKLVGAPGIAAGVGAYAAYGPLTGAATAAYAAVATQGFAAVTGALSSLFFLLIPIILLIVAVLVTVVIRQALLFFLIVISPVAIACFILPGTEKYFQKWWDLFIKTLLVYPIITTIFALSDVFASIIFSTNDGGALGIAKIVTGIIVIFAPIFMIPFAFKFAGGAVAALINAASGMGDKASKSGFVKARREFYGQRNKDSAVRGRAEVARRGSDLASTSGSGVGARLQRRAGRRLQKSAHGYRGDIFAQESAINERLTKEREAATNYGDDALWRAYTWSGREEDTRVHNGQQQVRTAGGLWTDRSNYDQAVKKFGGTGNAAAYQQGLTYEMGKATTQEEQDHIISSFTGAGQNRQFTQNEMIGAWKGAAFNKQNENRQWKHYTPIEDPANGGQITMQNNGLALMREIDEKQGAYAGTMQNADTWTTMSQEAQAADVEARRLGAIANRNAEEEAQYQTANETITRAARIAHSLAAGGGYSVPDEDAPGGVRAVGAGVGAGAPGRVGEEMRAFHAIATQVGASHGYNHDEYGTGQAYYDRSGGPQGPNQAIDDRDPTRR